MPGTGLLHDVVVAAAAFAATNVDDLVVLTTFFALAGAGRGPSAPQIVAGQYGGLAVLVGASALGAFGLLLIPDRYVRLLGLIPLAIGLWGLVAAIRGRAEDEPPPVLPVRAGTLGVAGITIANGGDNIAIYVPYFASAGGDGMLLIATVFAALLGVLCAIAAALGRRPTLVEAVEHYGHWAVPLVFIGLGAVILAEP